MVTDVFDVRHWRGRTDKADGTVGRGDVKRLKARLVITGYTPKSIVDHS